MHLAHYLGLLHRAAANLADAFREVADAPRRRARRPPPLPPARRQCDDHAEQLAPFAERYGEEAPDEPDRLHSELFRGTRRAASACCATCTTSTSWRPSATWPGR